MQVPNKPINISEIPAVASEYYENIFNVYQTQDVNNYYYYNLGNKINIDINNVDGTYIQYIFIDSRMPLTTISYRLFGTMHLWWLIAAMNDLNPVEIPVAGTVIAVPEKQYIQNILNTIQQQ